MADECTNKGVKRIVHSKHKIKVMVSMCNNNEKVTDSNLHSARIFLLVHILLVTTLHEL